MTKNLLVSMSLVVGLLIGAAEAGAQRGRGHDGPGLLDEGAVERRLTRLTERLALDEHQVTLVREILNDARAQGLALRGGAERGPERRARFRALMEATAGRIDAVLNDAQRVEFAALREEMRARRAARRAHRAGERGARGHRARALHGADSI